jgi:hypothetical protein
METYRARIKIWRLVPFTLRWKSGRTVRQSATPTVRTEHFGGEINGRIRQIDPFATRVSPQVSFFHDRCWISSPDLPLHHWNRTSDPLNLPMVRSPYRLDLNPGARSPRWSNYRACLDASATRPADANSCPSFATLRSFVGSSVEVITHRLPNLILSTTTSLAPPSFYSSKTTWNSHKTS